MPIAGSDFPVILRAADFHRIRADGISTQWRLNPYGYVQCNATAANGYQCMVARLVVQARSINGGAVTVKFRDDDSLNLLPSNLRVVHNPRQHIINDKEVQHETTQAHAMCAQL